MSRIVLITGASRGIGAEIAIRLAGPHHHVMVNFREKANRAAAVVDAVRAAGGDASTAQADITDERAVTSMLEGIDHLDVLVLNASGGLEPGARPDYAMQLNRDAQVRLAQLALPLMPAGGRIVFVTSHLAHFHGHKPVPNDYLPIAVSKQAGEEALRTMQKTFDDAGITFVVVSGDMIEDSTMVRLFERRDPDAIAARREASGGLPTAAQFAAEIVRAATAPVRSGDTVYVGGSDYLN